MTDEPPRGGIRRLATGDTDRRAPLMPPLGGGRSSAYRVRRPTSLFGFLGQLLNLANATRWELPFSTNAQNPLQFLV